VLFLVVFGMSSSSWPPAYGAHIAVQRDLYAHHGIVCSQPGEPIRVIHYSKTDGEPRIREEDYITAFLCHSPQSAVSVIPYDTTRWPPETVVARARRCIGQAEYRLHGNNCEHFANSCHSEELYSGQVERHASNVLGMGAVTMITGGALMLLGYMLGRQARRQYSAQ
jgi:hypothetical protein